jgi:hypothetical protein
MGWLAAPTIWPFSGFRLTEKNQTLNLQPKTSATADRSRNLINFLT